MREIKPWLLEMEPCANFHKGCVCVCVIFFYDDKAMGTHITLSQLDAAAPESSYPLGDKPVNQPARSQTLVGHSVNVVHRVCSLVSNFISRHL